MPLENPDTRWIQRFQNFEKAYDKFEFALSHFNKEQENELYQMALIQTFEFTYELGWKTIKDYLRYSGIKKANLPREVIKHGFQNQIIEDGQVWINMMEDRNLMAHTYNEENARKAVARISNEYCQAIKQLYLFFNQKIKVD